MVTKVDPRLYLDSVVGVVYGNPIMGRSDGGRPIVGTNNRSGVSNAYHSNGTGLRF